MSPDFSRPEQCPNGYRIRIIPPDSDDAGTQTHTRITAVVFGEKTTRAKLPRATAPQATPGAHRSSPSPRSAGRRSGKSFGLACMIRLQTAKTSEKTTLDWAGPSACCRGNHIQQAHRVGRHSVDSVFKSFQAPFRIAASSGN